MSLQVHRLETTVRSLCVRRLAPAHGADGWILRVLEHDHANLHVADRHLHDLDLAGDGMLDRGGSVGFVGRAIDLIRDLP